MEITDSIKIIQGRLSKFDLENAVNRIIGYVLLFYTPNDLALYASAPEKQFYSLTEKFIERLSSLTKNNAASQMPSSYPDTHQISDTSLSRNEFLANVYNQSVLVSLERQMHSSDLVRPDHSSNYHNTYARLGCDFGSVGSSRSPSSELDCSSKACYFFDRGSCWRGNHCRFSHGIVKDDDFLPESLDKLSVRIGGLLKEKNGTPGAISSLTYRENCVNYWKTVELIDGSHRQHSVVLAEEAPKYECDTKIFFTFPAESTFTDDDATSYFKRFGPVREVRIPREDKGGFGFVTFYYPESVKSILARSSSAHDICGSRVLVKPYKRRERTNICDRNYSCFNSDINTVPTMYGNSRLPDKQLLTEQHVFETERERLMKMQLNSQPTTPHRYSCFGIEDSKFSEVRSSSVHLSQNNGSLSDKKPTGNYDSDKEGDFAELPDNPFM